jgi:hypothetical protein
MAKKKKKINKTALIREALEKSPNSSSAEIAASLRRYGISAQYVSTIKSTSKKRAGKKKVGRKKKANTGEVSVSDLVKVSKFVDELGGIERAQEVLSVLAKIK